MVEGLPSALGFGIEQDPDLTSQRVERHPGVAVGKARKVGCAEANRVLQSIAQDFTSGTALAPQAYLHGEAVRMGRRDGKSGVTPRRNPTLIHAPTLRSRHTATPEPTSK